jgi:hypothetical protein
MIAMPLTEHGVSVHFPDNNYFQFGSCIAYRAIMSMSVKEMDICWLDVTNNILWAVEMKAFDNPANVKHIQQDLSQQNIIKHWINELYIKSVHTLSMLSTNRSGTLGCAMAKINDQTTFKLVHLLNFVPGQESYAPFIQDQLKALLKAYLAIFRVESVSVIPYNIYRGGGLIPWIV